MLPGIPVLAQFTAGATARDTYLQLGFVPDFVIVFAAHGATNPNQLWWFNQESLNTQWLDDDDHLLTTGSTGVITRVTTGIDKYIGGDLIAADETINSNPVHPLPDGTFAKAGDRTAKGIFFPAAVLTNDAKYTVVAFRCHQPVRQPLNQASPVTGTSPMPTGPTEPS